MAKGDHDEELVRRLAERLDEKGLTEIAYTSGRTSIRVSRQAAAAAPPAAAAPAPPTSAAQAATPSEEAPAPAPDADHPGAVTSPMVGTIYLQAEPGSPPFVAAGDKVAQGQTSCPGRDFARYFEGEAVKALAERLERSANALSVALLKSRRLLSECVERGTA